MPLSGKRESVWVDAMRSTDFPALTGTVPVDVAIVGGGIVGVTAAVLLKRAGKTVALIEAQRIGRQVTGHSNAKITSLHGLIYADLIERVGEEHARLYGAANQAAVEQIAAFVAERRIACAFERRPAFTFTEDPGRIPQIEAEVAAARRLGLPASLVPEADLPYPIAAAVRFDDQAQFNPAEYVRALAEEIPGAGSDVFEHTRVADVEDGERCRVKADRGTVEAQDVIVATNLPVVGGGNFHKKAEPRAHLVMAGRIDEAKAPAGMYLSVDPPTHSVRTTPADGGRLLIVVGESFATGNLRDVAALYERLERFMRERFGIDEITHRWANEDYDSQDRIPFVGRATRDARHLWVATGLSSWGISNGTAAGMVLADLITGKPNPWAEMYDATRQPGEAPNRGHPQMLQEEPEPPRPEGSWRDLKPGDGAVFEVADQDPVAIYRDDHGTFHAVSAVCTHLGCKVSWNNAERTWDCTCHGSTFEIDGRVIHGPAVSDLAKRRI